MMILDDEIGYAPATGPEQASTTKRTTRDGLHAHIVDVDVGDRKIRAYAAAPDGAVDPPLLLVLSEAFGLHEHIADIARRFAHEGYFAIAPDLMARQGDPMSYDDVGTLVSDLLLKIPDGQVIADLDATVRWARQNGASKTSLAATGFCWGGRWTWLYAAHRRMRAAVSWYGILDGTAVFPSDPALFPHHPIELANALQTPVLGLYGGRDDAIPTDTVRLMQRLLAEGDGHAKASQILLYPEAKHAFFADYRDSYCAEAAIDAWERCLCWLSDHRNGQIR